MNDIPHFYLNEPTTANALTLDILKHLIQEIDLAIANKAPAFIISSQNSKTFCSGGNLKNYKNLKTKALGVLVNRKMTGLIKSLRDKPILIIGALNGDVLGGGCEFISAFDFIIAADTVRLSFRQVNQALTFAWGGGARLLKRVGPGIATDWLTSGRWISASEALAHGLVDCVVSSDSLTVEAEDFARARSFVSPELIRSFKKIISAEGRGEEKIILKHWWSPDHLAALDKGIKKR